MFRIKLGEHITLGDISRGPHAVIECDHINEVVELIKSGVLRDLANMKHPENDHDAATNEMLRSIGIEPQKEKE